MKLIILLGVVALSCQLTSAFMENFARDLQAQIAAQQAAIQRQIADQQAAIQQRINRNMEDANNQIEDQVRQAKDGAYAQSSGISSISSNMGATANQQTTSCSNGRCIICVNGKCEVCQGGTCVVCDGPSCSSVVIN